MKLNKLLFTYILLICTTLCINAQVTIGSSTPAPYGALLQITEGNVTHKGLLLPRVELSDPDNLYPMFKTNNSNYISDKSNQDKLHKGLLVYNILSNDSFCKGIYVWSGTNWQKIYCQ